ncbi:ATP-binding protein [Patescibacteria group bacterium]|nr:ATP-binding protein [Patescibacteria group bacterium]
MAEVTDILKKIRNTRNDWLKNREPPWKTNPFDIKDIKENRKLFAGYDEQMKEFLSCVDRGQSALVTGNVGIGKTTFLKYTLEGLPKDEFKYVYCPKAPSSMKIFFGDITEYLTREKPHENDLTSLFRKAIDSIVEFVKNGMKFIVVIDELGEANKDGLHF